jgi:hypothetical protein
MKKKLSTLSWAGSITLVVLLLLLAGFQALWAKFSIANFANQSSMQRARVERIAKNALILARQPTKDEASQAINEMQLVLPIWQQVQTGLQAGDSSLGLPGRVPANIQLLMIQAQPDYISILTAAKKVLAGRVQSPDPIQAQIILDHERGYYLIMSQVSQLWQDHIDSSYLQTFQIELGIIALALVVVVFSHFNVTRAAIKQIKE